MKGKLVKLVVQQLIRRLGSEASFASIDYCILQVGEKKHCIRRRNLFTHEQKIGYEIGQQNKSKVRKIKKLTIVSTTTIVAAELEMPSKLKPMSTVDPLCSRRCQD